MRRSIRAGTGHNAACGGNCHGLGVIESAGIDGNISRARIGNHILVAHVTVQIGLGKPF